VCVYVTYFSVQHRLEQISLSGTYLYYGEHNILFVYYVFFSRIQLLYMEGILSSWPMKYDDSVHCSTILMAGQAFH